MEITEVQRDVLQEIGNIGIGHAATSLSGLLMHRIDISVPKVWILPFEEVAAIMGELDALKATVFLRVLGEAPGKALFFFPIDTAESIVQSLLCTQEKIDFNADEMARSALDEVGNIMVSSFLMALSQFSGVSLRPSVPALAVDMVGATLNEVFLEEGGSGHNAVLFVDTQLSGTPKIEGQFLFLPQEGSLEKLFGALGL